MLNMEILEIQICLNNTNTNPKKQTKMRTKKDRSSEIEAVFNGLKFCDIKQLNEVIEKAHLLIKKKKDGEIIKLESEIKKKQEALKELREI